jgi:hypothetical protein
MTRSKWMERAICGVLGLLVLLVLLFIQFNFGFYADGSITIWEYIVIVGGCGLVFVAVYGSFALLMLRMIVGPELFFRKLNAAVTIGAVPNQMAANLVTISARASILNLRHFIYDNPNCRVAVKEVLRSFQ